MTKNDAFNLITTETTKIIEETFSKEEIDLKFKEQLTITHFIPIRHRVLGGLYQSINIKFGNFLESLLKELINDTSEYSLVSSININKTIFDNKKFKKFEENRDVDGGKQTCFIISNRNQSLIDFYVNECVKADADKSKIEENFKNLLTTIQNNIKEEKDNPEIYDFTIFKNDVDLLFFKNSSNDYFYVELKKEDNHDSGKTKDMYRKVIKTFTCLLYEDYSNSNKSLTINSLTPILLFFGDIKNNSNILPKENVFSGNLFFDNYLSVTFDMINENMCEVSNSKKINEILMSKNKYILEYPNNNLIEILDEIIKNEIKEEMKIELKKLKSFEEILKDFDDKIKGNSKKITKKILTNLDTIEDELINKDMIIENWNNYSNISNKENLEQVLKNIEYIKECKKEFESNFISNKTLLKEKLEQKYNKKIIEKYQQE